MKPGCIKWRAWIALLAVWLFGASAPAVCSEWPEGYSVYEGSSSTDGRFGILVPSREAAGDAEEDGIKNLLADLKTRRVIAVIRRAHYFPGENHRDLGVVWGGDSSWCVVTYEGRYGFDSITVLRHSGAAWEQSDLGDHIQKALNSAIAQQTGSAGAFCSADARFRSGSEGTVLVRATGLTNPKDLPGQARHCAVFLGTFDPSRGKWIRSGSRKIETLEDMDSAFSDNLDEGITFDSAQSRLAAYDARLNEVYRALRILLPPPAFAALKKEQVAWLKQLEAAGTPEEKAKLIGERVRELRRLAWQGGLPAGG